MAKVLIIEDEPILRKRMAAIILAEGHQVIEAENGQEGIERLQERERPEVILLDMVMPHSSGWTFLDFQRSQSQFETIPVIVISAFENIAKSAKPNAFLPKPVDSADLLSAIAQFS
jgi:CheY-like chemotaxis protein